MLLFLQQALHVSASLLYSSFLHFFHARGSVLGKSMLFLKASVLSSSYSVCYLLLSKASIFDVARAIVLLIEVIFYKFVFSVKMLLRLSSWIFLFVCVFSAGFEKYNGHGKNLIKSFPTH